MHAVAEVLQNVAYSGVGFIVGFLTAQHIKRRAK